MKASRITAVGLVAGAALWIASGHLMPRDSADSQAAIRPDASGFAWDWSGAGPALDRPLWPIARSAAELLTGPAHEHVKQCPGAHCGWVFLDLTKNHRRRWCEMEVCGSRAKVRRYRERLRRADAA